MAHDTKAQHNPGPWRVAPELADTILCNGSGGYRISDMADDPLHPITPADVRLMAAAPEMLLALQKITRRIEVERDDEAKEGGSGVFLGAAILPELQAAIAKAQGAPTNEHV